MDFIDELKINDLIEDKKLNDESAQRAALEKAREAKGLELEEAAALLNIRSPELTEELFHSAKEVKERIYGNRLVLFAPLYLTNACVNNCLYCAFRRDNEDLKRRTLTLDEIEDEARELIRQGHKRLLLVCGEHPKISNLDFVRDAVERVYSIDENGNNIRRANINIAPLDLEGFRRLKTFNIGTYQIFQETYHYETYKTMHPSGPKADYSFRLDAPTRAIEAGIDDVGVGALFGLTDYRFETLAMLRHAEFLDREVGVGPHTISIPRLEPADHAPAAMRPPDAVSDHDFKKLVAALRLAVPYTGIILSTREKPELRRQVFELGVSQISAGSRTSPGSYKESKESLDDHELAQFQLGDHRPADEVIRDCCSLGYLPSFCTACYRLGRTGDRFMELAKSGAIGKICGPNALITFKEYLLDYGSEETKREGEAFIRQELAKQPDAMRRKIEEAITKLEAGEHDVFM